MSKNAFSVDVDLQGVMIHEFFHAKLIETGLKSSELHKIVQIHNLVT